MWRITILSVAGIMFLAPMARADEAKAVEAIVKLDDDVDRDEELPGNPVYKVTLSGAVRVSTPRPP